MRPKYARPATKADEIPEFEEFWRIWQAVKSEYDARASARDGFFHYVWWRDVDPADLVDAARYYAQNFKSGQYRMLARKWMDRGFYEDDAEKWRTFQAHQAERQNQSAKVVSIAAPRGQTAFLREWDQKQKAKQG